MPLKGEAKRAQRAAYMRRRRLEKKALAWEERVRQERKVMKKALRRLAQAKEWAAAGEKIDECWLSLGWQWNNAAEEEEQAKKDAKCVAVALGVPARFESLP